MTKDEHQGSGERHPPTANEDLLSSIPPEIMELLSPADISLLSKAESKEDFIRALQAIRDREMKKLQEKDKLAFLLEIFLEEKTERENRLLANIFQKMKQTMVNLTAGREVTPMDTPVNRAMVEQFKKKDEGKWK